MCESVMETGLSLGTNMGNRLARLTEAKQQILAEHGITCTAQSPAYETDPVGVLPEFTNLNFLNAILIIETMIPIHRLLSLFQHIEQKLGRTASMVRNMPRPMDIDIIYAGRLSIKKDEVTIPHPRWAERRFVVQPLYDVRPDLHVPGQSGTVSDVLSRLTDSSKVSVFASDW